MADETETTTETETQDTPETEQQSEERVHPLAPGGVRFEEVVREKNELKAEAAALRAQLARQQTVPEPPKPEPKPQMYTADQLQQAVDAGRITAAQMADQLAWQRAQEVRQIVTAETQVNQKRASATAEVNGYLERIPALNDPTSREFLRASRAAAEVAEDMGWDVRDPRVQRLALRATFGSLDRLADQTRTREFARDNADTTLETRGGGHRSAPPSDPYRQVPQALKDHWARLGYSDEQKKAELPFIDFERWKRRG